MGNKSSKTAGGDSAADKSKEEIKKDKSQVVATAGTSSPAPAALVAATGDKTGDKKKMLVALDHSEQSLLAVRWILDNFVNTGDDVTLVTAFEAFKPKPRVPMIQEPLTEGEQISVPLTHPHPHIKSVSQCCRTCRLGLFACSAIWDPFPFCVVELRVPPIFLGCGLMDCHPP